MSDKNNYNFGLILSGVDGSTKDLEDALFEAGCDDALLHFRYNTVYMDFDRQANCLAEAIVSAIQAVEAAGIGAIVSTVRPEALVTISDIAMRTGLTRQAIENYTAGRRGRKNFPLPVSKIDSRSALWRWIEVAEWLYQHNEITDPQLIVDAHLLEFINLVLLLRNRYTDKALLKQFLGSLNCQNDEIYDQVLMLVA